MKKIHSPVIRLQTIRDKGYYIDMSKVLTKKLLRALRLLKDIKPIIDALECACDEGYGYRCNMHGLSERIEQTIKLIVGE